MNYSLPIVGLINSGKEPKMSNIFKDKVTIEYDDGSRYYTSTSGFNVHFKYKKKNIQIRVLEHRSICGELRVAVFSHPKRQKHFTNKSEHLLHCFLKTDQGAK